MVKSGKRTNTIREELTDLNRRGRFIASVLTDGDGLPLAAVTRGDGQLAEMLAAMAPLVQRLVQRSNQRAGLSMASEVVINNADNSRMVCRFFEARRQPLILACVVPGRTPFRRAINTAVRHIQSIWGG